MKHILVIRMSAMGDVAMTVPIIRTLVQQNLDVRVTVVSRPFFKPFFDDIERVDFFGVDLKNRHKGFLGIYKLYQALKKLHIDYVADLHNVLRSKILRSFFKISGTQVAFTDKGRADKKALTRAENKVFRPVKSMIDRHLDTFSQLGFQIDLSKNKFPSKKLIPHKVIDLVGEKHNVCWIGIAPFAQYDTKVYPQDLMAKTIALLSSNKSNRILLFGGGTAEIDKLHKLQQNFENVTVVAGILNFEQELHLIQNLDVMLSMDSGNGHIAAMYGVPVVTLWGQTHPYAGFVPFNQPLTNSLTPNLDQYPLIPTSVYGNKIIPGYADAMRTIDPRQVVLKINESLQQLFR